MRQFLSDQARQQGIWLVAGTLPISDPNSRISPMPALYYLILRVTSAVPMTRFIYLMWTLDKADLSDGSRAPIASRIILAVVLRLWWHRQIVAALGMTVCYDLRFAELYRQLADLGAQIVTVPAAFTAATGRDHWLLLLRARAVENQLFVIGANMVDREHPRRALWGGSAIIDPWGNLLASLDDEPGVAVAEIDLTVIDKVRAKMPVSLHRKL